MSYDAEVLADLPWGYWKLDESSTNDGETAADSSGNGNDGTYWRNSASPITHPTPNQPPILSGDPTSPSVKFWNGAVHLPNHSLKDEDYTLEFWTRYVSTSTLPSPHDANPQSLWFQGAFGFAGLTVRAYAGTSDQLAIDHYDAGLTATSYPLTDGGIYHIVFRRDQASDLMAIFINGDKVAENNNGPITGTDVDFWWGNIANVGNWCYVSHIAVYRSASGGGGALDDTRILAHYDVGSLNPAAPVVFCGTATATTINLTITPTVGADSHEIYVSDDPSFDPDTDSPLFSDLSLGTAPTSYLLTGLTASTDYYIIVRSISSTSPYVQDSTTTQCQTASAGAAPAFVSVAWASSSTANFFTDTPSGVLRVYYEWRISSSPGNWSVLLGSTSKTGANRFTELGTGITPGALHTVRARFEYVGGLSTWTETEWYQLSGLPATTVGGDFIFPPGPGYVIDSSFVLEWAVQTGYSATELAESVDGTSYTTLATSGLGAGTYAIDPTVYSGGGLVWYRVTVVNGSTTIYLYAVVFIDLTGSILLHIGVDQPDEITTSEFNGATLLGTGPVWFIPATDPYLGSSLAGVNGTNAAIIFPSVTAQDSEGFQAIVSGGAAASGNTLTWWMNEEVEGSSFGLRYYDEVGGIWAQLNCEFLTRMPYYPPCDSSNLRGQALITLQVRENVLGSTSLTTVASQFVETQGFFPIGPCAIIRQSAMMQMELTRPDPIGAPESYSYGMNFFYPRAVDPTRQLFQASGSVSISGSLPCGYVAPYISRVASGFIGYPILFGFAWGPYGSGCSAGIPSGFVPGSFPITCDALCDCVTITPNTLAVQSATEIRYEISTDPSFGSVLVSEGFRAINVIPAKEVFEQCSLSPGKYYARYLLIFGSSGTEEASDTCEFDIISLDVAVWDGWRPANSLQSEPVVADFSYTVISSAVVQFTDESVDLDGPIRAWLWTFKTAGGVFTLGTSTDQNPTFDFGSEGTYEVTLFVQSDDSNDTITMDIDVVTPSLSSGMSSGMSGASGVSVAADVVAIGEPAIGETGIGE